MLQPNESTLICTLGGQPQVVTFALDWLLGRGELVRQVTVLYVASPDGRVARALARLEAEFDGSRYPHCRLQPLVIRQAGQALTDIQTDAAAEATREMVHHLIVELKQAARSLHLCLAGGPRLMGLMALSAAMLHCGHQDRVWHVYTRPEFRRLADEGQLMHDQTGQNVRLVQVPMVPWGAYIPALQSLGRSPTDLMRAQTAWLDETERRHATQVWSALTDRPRAVLRLLAQGHTPQEAAAALTLSLKTVDTYKTTIFAECRNAWNLPDGERLTYFFLREKFGPILEALTQDVERRT